MVKVVTRPYRNYNEDGYIIEDGFYVVMDGATTLIKGQSSENDSIAKRFVDYAKMNLYKFYKESNNFLEALHRLSQESYHHFNIKTNIPAELPSMALVCAIEQKNHYEIFIIGDSGVGIKYLSGRYKLKMDTRVKALDQIAVDYKYKNHVDFKDILIKHRNLLGIKYQALIPSLDMVYEPIKFRVMKNKIEKILLFTDGYFSMRDTFMITKKNIDFINYDLDLGLKRIVEVAYEDPDMQKYRRLKVIDDITALMIQ